MNAKLCKKSFSIAFYSIHVTMKKTKEVHYGIIL